EVAAEGIESRTSPPLVMLKRGQDLLGRLHDLQILIDRARQVQASLTPPNIKTWRELESLVDGLEDDCRRLHARYMHGREVIRALAARMTGRPRSLPTRKRSA